MKKLIITGFIICSALLLNAQSYEIALLKYRGGGDWYANLKTSLPNLIAFANKEAGMNIKPEQAIVEVGSLELFNYPFVHMTGHGNVVFNRQEAENLRKYLESGGFLHIDDNYGMDPYVRREMKKVFPDADFVELPASYPVYRQFFTFPDGIPKIHEHDGEEPMGYGIFLDGRMVVFYSYETDLGNGWEDPEIHDNPVEKHIDALKMGVNLLQYAFSNGRKE